MTAPRRPGTRFALWLTLVVGVGSGLFGAAVAFLAQVGNDSEAHAIPLWGWLLLPLVALGPVVAARGWHRYGSRLLVLLGLALSLVPLVVNGLLTAPVNDFGWTEVFTGAGLFLVCGFGLMLLLTGPEPTVG